MKERIKHYQAQLKKKHSVAWTPNYQESFNTSLNFDDSKQLAKEILPIIGLLPITHTKYEVRAVSKERWNRENEYIVFKYEKGKITIKSQTVGKMFWDIGRNYKWVKVFIFVFKELEIQKNNTLE